MQQKKKKMRNVQLRVRLKFGQNAKRAAACAFEIWAKRTRACDMRAAEN